MKTPEERAEIVTGEFMHTVDSWILKRLSDRAAWHIREAEAEAAEACAVELEKLSKTMKRDRTAAVLEEAADAVRRTWFVCPDAPTVGVPHDFAVGVELGPCMRCGAKPPFFCRECQQHYFAPETGAYVNGSTVCARCFSREKK